MAKLLSDPEFQRFSELQQKQSSFTITNDEADELREIVARAQKKRDDRAAAMQSIETFVKQLLRDRKLLAVTRPGGERAIPAAFLHGDQIVKGLSGTLTVLFDCGFADEEALRWLFTADATLPGTPIDALNAHRGTEVNRRAQALAF